MIKRRQRMGHTVESHRATSLCGSVLCLCLVSASARWGQEASRGEGREEQEEEEDSCTAVVSPSQCCPEPTEQPAERSRRPSLGLAFPSFLRIPSPRRLRCMLRTALAATTRVLLRTAHIAAASARRNTRLCPTDRLDSASARSFATKMSAPAAAPAAAASSVDPVAQIAQIKAKFAELGIAWRVTEHEAVPDVAAFKASAAGALSGKGAKNLFVKDKKKQLYLVCAANDAQVNLGGLAKLMGVAGGPMRMEGADVLLSTLGVTPGSVTPLAVLNDDKNSVIVLLDAALDKAEFINVHPLVNTATVQVTPAELRQFVKATGHEMQVVDLAAIAGEAPAAGAAGAEKPKAAKPAKPAAAAKAASSAASSSASGNQTGIQAKKETDFHNWSVYIHTIHSLDQFCLSVDVILQLIMASLWSVVCAACCVPGR